MGVRRHLLDTVGGVAVATPVEQSGNRTGDAELTQANFDTNMVIILAALLCALICALGLNSIVRCVLRCSRRLGVDSAAEQAAARTGLKKSALRKIPIFVYGSDRDTWTAGMNPGSECPICLGEFVDGEKVRVLPECNHGFHVSCIDTWLGSHSSCPNCRHSLLDDFSSTKAAAATLILDDGGGGVATPPQLPREGGSGGGGQEHVVVEVNAGS